MRVTMNLFQLNSHMLDQAKLEEMNDNIVCSCYKCDIVVVCYVIFHFNTIGIVVLTLINYF